MDETFRGRKRALWVAAAVAGVLFLAGVGLRAWEVVAFVVAVAACLGLSVVWVARQEAQLRSRDDVRGCTTYAKVYGSGTFLMTLDETGITLMGSSPSTRRLPTEQHAWADVEDLRIERAGPFGSAGELSVRLPNRVLRASIGRVDEMIAVANEHGPDAGIGFSQHPADT